MKRIGVREFRDHATQYLAGDDVLLVERHGEPIGLYIPTRSAPHRDRVAAVQQLQQTVERILQKTGLTEDELADLLDLTNPLRSDSPPPPGAREGKPSQGYPWEIPVENDEHPTPEEVLDRLSRLPPIHLDEPIEDIIRKGREER